MKRLTAAVGVTWRVAGGGPLDFLLGHPLVATKKLRRRRLPCVIIISGARLPDQSCFPPHGTTRDGVEFDEGQAEALYLTFAQHILVLHHPFRQPEDLYGGGGGVSALPVDTQAVADARWIAAFQAFNASPMMAAGTTARRYMLHAQDYYVVQAQANRKARETRAAIAAAYPSTASAGAADALYDGDRGDDDDDDGRGGGGERRDEPDPRDQGLYEAEARQLVMSEMFAAHDEMDMDAGKRANGRWRSIAPDLLPP